MKYLRTSWWYIKFALSLIPPLIKLFKANALKKNGALKEHDAYVYQTTSRWARKRVTDSGSQVEVSGMENLKGLETVVFISNHQGNFDIPILMGYVDKPKGFIAKIETKKIPVVRTWMTHMHCVFMDRSTLKGSAGAIVEGINLLKAGHSLIIFPEGTRSKGNQMRDFKAASFKLAIKPKVPIVPITISGSYKIMESNQNFIVPAKVKLYIHPPIETDGLSKEALEALPEKIAGLIASKLENNE